MYLTDERQVPDERRRVRHSRAPAIRRWKRGVPLQRLSRPGALGRRAPRPPGTREDGLIRSITYVSSATRLLDDRELLVLLDEARARNDAAGVTGLLLYHGGNFIQVLEGPDDAVRDTMDRIARDPRHDGLITILDDAIDQRVFPDWSMAFRNVSDIELASRAGYSTYLDDHASLEGFGDGKAQVLKLLELFRRNVR